MKGGEGMTNSEQRIANWGVKTMQNNDNELIRICAGSVEIAGKSSLFAVQTIYGQTVTHE